jgi:hypothetical protein
MRWSKAKKLLEELMADSVKGRIQFYVTSYGPGHSSTMARAWITWDKQELVNMSSAEWLMETYSTAGQIQEINRATSFTEPQQREGYYLTFHEAERISQEKGIFSRSQFEEAVEEYLNLSITAALDSDNPIIKALSMLDRRLGQRRLKQLQLDRTEHSLVRMLYLLRCEAEEKPE